MLPDRLAYNRLETDEEFRERVVNDRPNMPMYLARALIDTDGKDLDDLVWVHFGAQRRIIFVPA